MPLREQSALLNCGAAVPLPAYTNHRSPFSISQLLFHSLLEMERALHHISPSFSFSFYFDLFFPIGGRSNGLSTRNYNLWKLNFTRPRLKGSLSLYIYYVARRRAQRETTLHLFHFLIHTISCFFFLFFYYY